MHIRRISLLSIAALIFLLTAGCSGGGIGYGVVLWAPDDAGLAGAAVVRVVSESTIEESYIVKDLESGDTLTLPRWRVEFYDRRSDAESAADSYRPYADLLALSREVGLPVRQEPDALSDRVYRLRQEEEIKILDRSPEMSEVGSYTGYWYKILTRDGTIGYCFDHYLVIYEAGGREEALAVRNEDPRVDDFFTRSYYPERFLILIDNGTIDLRTIRPEMGMFPDAQAQTVEIVAPKYQVDFPYEEVAPAGNNRYQFTDTSLYVTFEDPRPPVTSLLAQFKVGSTDVTSRYVAIPELEEIIADEQTRREEALAALLEGGGTFVSSAYGTLVIDESGGFVWRGKERLVPSVLKENFGDRGVIRFDRWLDPGLRGEYDGAASFRFASAADNQAVSFLYTIEEQGLRLTLVPEGAVSDLVITGVGFNSLVLFMSRQE